MAIPQAALIVAKYGPTVYSVLKGLFSGKSKQEKALEELQRMADKGLDPNILLKALAAINAQQQAAGKQTLGRLAAGGIDPRSGLAQEVAAAAQRGYAGAGAQARQEFGIQNQAFKQRLLSQIAGQPADTSTGDLLSALLQNLAVEYGGGNRGEQTTLANVDRHFSEAPNQTVPGIRMPSVEEILRPPAPNTGGVGMRVPSYDDPQLFKRAGAPGLRLQRPPAVRNIFTDSPLRRRPGSINRTYSTYG